MLATSYLLLAAALNISAVSASPTPAPSQLREIGHVRATAYCAELALHSNTAISAALRNDAVLTETIEELQTAKLEGNAIARRNTMNTLGGLAKDLRARAVAGDREAAKLREMAAKSNDAVQKKELKDFADALGGALYRQKKIANDLNGMLAFLDYHDMKPSAAEMETMSGGEPVYTTRDQERVQKQANLADGNTLPYHEAATDTQIALSAAGDFKNRLPDITSDEASASTHAIGATSGC